MIKNDTGNENENENENEEFHDAKEVLETKVNIDNNEYKAYRKYLLGKDTPDRVDDNCEFFLLNDINQIKKFSEIKSSAINFQLNEDHIKNMVRQIEDAKQLYFPSSIAIIEYKKYSTDTPKNLIEIIDGHHRVECIKILLEKKTIKKMSVWVQIYKTYSPTSEKTIKIFKLYNNVKPFKVNFEILDLKLLLVAKLNDIFKTDTFTLIKDTQSNVNRPSFQKKAFCDKLEEQLNEQIQVSRKELSKDMVNNIITKFQTYNKTLLNEKDFEWFNNKANNSYSGKITENQYKIARSNNCMLGLIKLEFLICQCVNL
jgi:hypothetical protein